jgi:2-polyprenyl-6-methoxyphenol hydroxylase-like FAD-dependent oxidoreductase
VTDVQVLIAGAGPTGLTLAICLGQAGVTTMVIDSRPAPARLPRAEYCNAATMEIFRRLGISGRVRAAGLPPDVPMDEFTTAGSLAGQVVLHARQPSVNALLAAGRMVNDGTMPLEPYQVISQYTLEPLLRDIAEATPHVTVRFGTELFDFAATSGGVTAVASTTTRPAATIRAGYLVGCDGAESTVRTLLGIGLRGQTRQTMRQALLYAPDLFDRIPAGRGRRYRITGPVQSLLMTQDDTHHFAMHTTSDAPLTELFGMPVSYKILYEGTWTQRLMLADGYGSGRVFLAGDAAHLITGTLGMNTGIGDATDLGWKLAGTLQGWAGPALLRSYEPERRVVALRNVIVSERGADADSAGIDRGYRYTMSPIIATATGRGPDPDDLEYTPTSWPGSRLPHIWLEDGVPVHDELGTGYTLLRLGAAHGVRGRTRRDELEGYTERLATEFRQLAAPLDVLDVGSEAAQAVYGGHRLILVRPDLHVAWRSGDSVPDPRELATLVTGWIGWSSI